MWEKEKLLVTSNFSFSHSVSRRPVLQTHKNQGLFGKGLFSCQQVHSIWTSPNLCCLVKSKKDGHHVICSPKYCQVTAFCSIFIFSHNVIYLSFQKTVLNHHASFSPKYCPGINEVIQPIYIYVGLCHYINPFPHYKPSFLQPFRSKHQIILLEEERNAGFYPFYPFLTISF